MDLDQNPLPSTASFWCFFLFPLIFNIMSFNIDACVVINDYHHLRGGWGGHSSKSSMRFMKVTLAMTAMAPRSALIINRKLQPDSKVVRIHVVHIMKAFIKELHNSLVAQACNNCNGSMICISSTENFSLDSNVLRILGLSKHLECNHHNQRAVKCVCM